MAVQKGRQRQCITLANFFYALTLIQHVYHTFKFPVLINLLVKPVHEAKSTKSLKSDKTLSIKKNHQLHEGKSFPYYLGDLKLVVNAYSKLPKKEPIKTLLP